MAERKNVLAFAPDAARSKRAKRFAAWFQFAAVAAALGLLAALFFDRVGEYQERAEKAGMEVAILNMRTGLRFKVAELLIHGQEGEIHALVGGNPAGLLQPTLPNYAGEIDSAQAERVAPGRWYFVRDLGELRYRVMRDRRFAHISTQPAEVRLRVVAASVKPVGTGGAVRVEGVSLILLQPYRWF